MPDIKFKTKEEMPEEFREHAVEKDGAFTVNLVANKKLQEFRDNNIAVSQERDGYKTKHGSFTSILGYDDPEKLKTELTDLRSIAQKVKDGTLKTNEAIEAEVARRAAAKTGEVEGAVSALKEQVTAANQGKAQYEGKFRSLLLNQAVAAEVLSGDSGFSPSALTDIQNRAQAGGWKVGDDDSVALMKDGKVVYSKKEPGTPMPMKEWLAGLLAEAPHFSKSSAGGGANGGRDASGETVAGMPKAEFQKLPPQKRIELYRKSQQG